MAYNISKKSKKVPDKYYTDLEIKELRKKYKGHIPPATEIMRVGTRNVLQIEKIIHREGHIVNYKDGLAIVRKSEKRGLWLEPFKKDRTGIATPSGKLIFVKQKNVEHQVYPVSFPNLPIGVIAPYNMATVDE
jgi:hypothetical protein